MSASPGPSIRSLVRIVVVVVASVIALYLIYRLRKPITWIVIGGFIAIALSAPVTGVQRRPRHPGLSIASVYLGFIPIPGLVGAILVPPPVQEAHPLVGQGPAYRTR